MPLFATIYHYADDSADTRDEHRPAHRAWLGEQKDAGILKASGPWAAPHSGALLLWESHDEASLRELLPADPFAAVGVIRQTDVYEWTQVFGPFTA